MKNNSSKSPSFHPLLTHALSLQAGNPVRSWDLVHEGKGAEIFTRGMHPSVESVRLLSDQPHSHSSKAESCFPSSVPFCHLPLIMSQTGKAGAPRRRSDTWHFLTGRARNVLLHPKVVDGLPARRSRSHWPVPCVGSQAVLSCPTSTLPCRRTSQAPALAAGWSVASLRISEKSDKESVHRHLISKEAI